MVESAASTRHISMKGGGYYSKATIGAKDVIDGGTPMIMEALSTMDIPDIATPFTMADSGCADGGTSVTMVGTVLKEVRRRAPNRPIQMVYTDLPRNDFSQVFRNIHGETDVDTYIDDIDNLYVFSSATSFHKPMFPAGTLNLGFSATASHYISEKPSTIANHVHMVGAAAKRRLCRAGPGGLGKHAVEPGKRFGRRREACAFPISGIDEEGRYLGSTGGISMFDTFNELWAALRDDGTITTEEYLNTNFPQSYRTVEQFTAPFVEEDNPVYKAGLRMEHVETRVVECPYEVDFRSHGDAEKFAREYIPTLRSWAETTFAAGLSAERSPEECQEILDRYFDNYEQRVREHPTGHAMDYVHCYLIVEKV